MKPEIQPRTDIGAGQGIITFMIGQKILEEKESKYNGHLKVIRSWGLGTYIQASGLTQSGGVVETIWGKTVRKIKNLRPKVRNALILGYGGGTVAKLLKKNWQDIDIEGVDIDPVIVELGKKYLGDQKINIKIGDASDYVKLKPAGSYDLVIVDLYNGDKFPEKFEKESFLKITKKLLTKDGIAVFNRLYYGAKRPLAAKFGKKLEEVFSKVDWHFPEANVMLICQDPGQ